MNKIASQSSKQAREIATSDYVTIVVRLGYFVRGALYTMVGLLAIQLMIGVSQRSDLQDILNDFSEAPFSSVLLAVTILGLAGYSIWGFIRSILDLVHLRRSEVSISTRIGYLISAFSYAALIAPGVLLILHRYSEPDSPFIQRLTAEALQLPMGFLLIYLAGVASILAGIFQLRQAFRSDLHRLIFVRDKDFKNGSLFSFITRYGIASRAVVFSLIGFYLVAAAYTSDAAHAKNFGQALESLYYKPFGAIILSVTALGLIAFGFYSMFLSFLVRLPDEK